MILEVTGPERSQPAPDVSDHQGGASSGGRRDRASREAGALSPGGGPPESGTVVMRLAAWLVRLFPEPFRERYGQEVETHLAERGRENRATHAGRPFSGSGFSPCSTWCARRSRSTTGSSRGAELPFPVEAKQVVGALRRAPSGRSPRPQAPGPVRAQAPRNGGGHPDRIAPPGLDDPPREALRASSP